MNSFGSRADLYVGLARGLCSPLFEQHGERAPSRHSGSWQTKSNPDSPRRVHYSSLAVGNYQVEMTSKQTNLFLRFLPC